MTDQSSWIIETSTQQFEADVIERSKQVPVVVDFWAPWCEPCRQLTPVLEKLVREFAGKFTLVKVNVDEAQELAMALRVQSIPLVMAFRNGELVDQFAGVAPEQDLRQWFSSLLPSPAADLAEEGKQLESTDPAAAEAKYREALQLDPEDGTVKAHLARVLLAQDREDECRQVIGELEARGYLEPEAERLKAQLDLQTAAEESGGVEEARRAAEANPDDMNLQLKLADALAAQRSYQEALEICLSILERDKRSEVGAKAKETMLKIFELLEPQSELASTYRRKLATVLY